MVNQLIIVSAGTGLKILYRVLVSSKCSQKAISEAGFLQSLVSKPHRRNQNHQSTKLKAYLTQHPLQERML